MSKKKISKCTQIDKTTQKAQKYMIMDTECETYTYICML